MRSFVANVKVLDFAFVMGRGRTGGQIGTGIIRIPWLQ